MTDNLLYGLSETAIDYDGDFENKLELILNEFDKDGLKRAAKEIEGIISDLDKNERVDGYVSKHLFDKNFSVKRAAKIAGMSEVYFRRLFNERHGMSPLKYVTAMRIERAKMLLEHGENVTDTAKSVGFSDPLYFSRVFRAQTGFAPSRYKDRDNSTESAHDMPVYLL